MTGDPGDAGVAPARVRQQVLKASGVSPYARRDRATLDYAGLPPGVHLITQRRTRPRRRDELTLTRGARINFTGSPVGRSSPRLARHSTGAVELGERALGCSRTRISRGVAAANSVPYDQGQICMSPERIVVDRSVAEPFTDSSASARCPYGRRPRERTQSDRSLTELSGARCGLVDDASPTVRGGAR